MVLGTALLAVAPWGLLLHLEEHSIHRFVAVCADFPSFARAYAYEEVGKYYRKHATDGIPENATPSFRPELMVKAQEMYERCVESYPGNPRFRILLGSIYFMQAQYEKAGAQYQKAFESDPHNAMALEMLGKVAVQRNDWSAAVDWFKRETEATPNKPDPWELLGYAAAKADRPEEVIRAYERTMALDPRKSYWPEVGAAYFELSRLQEAATAFRQGLAHGSVEPRVRMGLAFSLVDLAVQAAKEGKPFPAAWLDEATSQARSVQQTDPTDNGAAKVLDLVARLRGGPQKAPAPARLP